MNLPELHTIEELDARCRDYERIRKAIGYLSANFRAQPSLEAAAAQANLSPYHFQRIFSRWAGVSPKKFVEYLSVEALKADLADNISVAAAADRTGLSGPSRVHDLFVNIEAMTPAQYRDGGAGQTIRYGFAPTPFGRCAIASTTRGICGIWFVDASEEDAVESLREQWHNAYFIRDDEHMGEMAVTIFGRLAPAQPLAVTLKGTPFQLKVWKALLEIPEGTTVSYSQLAEAAGNPAAVRAAASAVARNPIAYLIPCHRVIRGEGLIGQYRWNAERKTALIGWEKSQCGK